MQSRIATCAAADVDAVELGAEDGRRSRTTSVRVLDVDPVLAADDGHVAIVTSSARMTIPPRTTAPRSPTSVWRVVEHERPLVHARREVDGRRPRRPGDAARGREQDAPPRPRSAGAGAAELAAVLAVGQPRRSGKTAWPSTCASSHAPAKSATRQPSGASTRDREASTIDAGRARAAPSGTASQPGW